VEINYNELAKKHDETGIEIRSKRLHEIWLSRLGCRY